MAKHNKIRFTKEICKFIMANDRKPEFRHSTIRIINKWSKYPYACTMHSEEGLAWLLLMGNNNVIVVDAEDSVF